MPLALRGIRYRPASASVLLRRNLLVYGLGGLLAALRRHQAHRHHRQRPRARLRSRRKCSSHLRPALVMIAAMTVAVRHRLSARDDRRRPSSCFPRRRMAASSAMPAAAVDRLEPHRAGLHRPALFPPAALGRRGRLRRRRVERPQSRADQRGADCRHHRAHDGAGSRGEWPSDPDRPRHRLRLGPRPPYLAGSGRAPGRARRGRTGP